MKQINTILNVILALAVTILFILYFKDANSEKSVSQKNKQPVMSQGNDIKIAYINSDTLYQYYNYYEDIVAGYKKKREKAERQLKSRATKLQNKMISFQKRAQAGLMSQNEIQSKQKELVKEEKDIQMYQQTIMEGLVEEEKELNNNLYDKITDFLKEYNRGKNYSIIIGYARGNMVWYADDALDITQEVLDGLNEKYAAKQK